MKSIFSDKRNLKVFVAALLFSGFVQSVHFHGASLLVIPHWFDHWLVNYSSGFIRRGLLGSFLDCLGGLQHNAIFINTVGVVVSFCIVILLIRQLVRVLPADSLISLLILSAFILSPLISVFFECCGDPLQVTLLLAFLAISLATRDNLSLSRKFVIFTGLMSLSIFIHEASIFISGGIFLVFILHKKTASRIGIIFCYLFILAALAGAIISADRINDQKDSLLKQMFSENPLINRTYQARRDSLVLKPVEDVIKDSEFYQSTVPESILPLSRKILGVAVMPFLLCYLFLCIFGLQKRQARGDFFKIYIFLMIFSLPLYLLAIDWGRFSMYVFSLSLYLFFKAHEHSGPVKHLESRKIFLICLLILMIFPINRNYRMGGLEVKSLLFACLAGLPLFSWIHLTNREA